MPMRSWRGVALAAALVVLLSGCDWTMFGFNATRSRFSPDTTISPSNVANLREKWTGITGGGVDSSPAVANGVLYVGANDDKLYAFDAAGKKNCSGKPTTCAPLWTAATGGAVRSSPAVVNGVVYVGSSDDKLYAFDANGAINCSGIPKTCVPLWTAQTGGACGIVDSIGLGGCLGSSPVVVHGVVYIDSYDTNLYAFDANGRINCSGIPKTCDPLWTAPTGVYGHPEGVGSSPAVANGVVYVGAVACVCSNFISFNINFLVAFDANGHTNCGGIPKTCGPLWTSSVGQVPDITVGESHSSPAVANGVVYIGTGGGDNHLYGYDAAGVVDCSGTPKTCSPSWSANTGGGVNYSSAAVAYGMVYVGSADGKLYAFDTTSKAAPWVADAPFAVVSSPAVANGVVYIGSSKGTLLAFDARTGARLWSAATADPIYSSPAIANGMIYVASDNGSVGPGSVGSVHAYGLG